MQTRTKQRQAQRGAVLIVSLILLLVMTILAISSSQVVRLQERMAGNTRDTDLALQGAEAALRDAEQYIQNLSSLPSPLCTSTSTTGCMIFEAGVLRPSSTFDLRTAAADTATSWWRQNAREYRTAATTDIPGLTRDPKFVIERVKSICDSGEICTDAEALTYFRTTAQSFGGSQTADVRLESTYVRRGL